MADRRQVSVLTKRIAEQQWEKTRGEGMKASAANLQSQDSSLQSKAKTVGLIQYNFIAVYCHCRQIPYKYLHFQCQRSKAIELVRVRIVCCRSKLIKSRSKSITCPQIIVIIDFYRENNITCQSTITDKYRTLSTYQPTLFWFSTPRLFVTSAL